jgi:hypothetical protein
LLAHALVLSASPQSVISTVKNEVAGVVKKPFQSPELIGAIQRIRKSK